MVAPPLGLIECLAAALVREVEPTKTDPDFSQVELDHIFDDAVAAVDGDRQAALEKSTRLLEVSDFGVKNSEVVENPGHRLSVTRHLESAEAVGVIGGGLGVITAHAGQDAAILFDHSE